MKGDLKLCPSQSFVLNISFSLRFIHNMKPMRLFVFCVALAISTGLSAQSKKELTAEVNKLKAETVALKTEIVELKKPKEVSLNTIHQKASYGLGVLMATQLKSQGGDSLDLDVLTAGIKDLFQGKPL